MSAFVYVYIYLLICVVFKWFMPQTPYLIQYYTKTPHITSTGITFEMQSLQQDQYHFIGDCVITSGAVHLIGIIFDFEM